MNAPFILGLGLFVALPTTAGFPLPVQGAGGDSGVGRASAQTAEQSPDEVLIDPHLPDYVAVRGVAGSIKCVGSDTMNNLLHLWNQGFAEFYPNVVLEGEGMGSASAPPALIEGSATFGPMSRPMKAEELDAFAEAFGYTPTGLITGIDMLAVYVHKDNPLRGLTLEQVDGIFSRTRLGGYTRDITTWDQLGLEGAEWRNKPISIYGRNPASGTYGYFKDHALFKGDFKGSVKEQSGSAAVVSGVAGDKYAIGYSGIGYRTADVRALPLRFADEPEYVAANPGNAYSGAYPLARPLLLYVNLEPESELDPLRSEYLKFLYSRQGQGCVPRDGFLPIVGRTAQRELAKVGIAIELADQP